MRFFAIFTLSVFVLLLSGCAVKEPQIKPYNYTLDPVVSIKRYTQSNNDVLKIGRIEGSNGLNTRSILYKKDGALQPYKYGIWSEMPSSRLQYLIAEALQDQHQFHSTVTSTSMAMSNLILEPILQEFEEVFSAENKSHVHVGIRFRLVDIKTGQVINSTKISSKKEVTNKNGAQGTVEAFNGATSEVIEALSLWLNDIRK
ncbi:MAG: ABC-type transport auxiliary lipoprotein family protein [Sulfurospirillaceae bacterium]|nr:ABC-type transport auxiliary lipoprotein family protein [Sulfurospirillaceae bacterium]